MRIIVVGAGGNIGRAVCEELGPRHEIITAGRTSGDIRVDLADKGTVSAMYAKAGKVDAVISATGDVRFSPLEHFSEDQFMIGLRYKVMGQINLVLEGMRKIADRGSFTLTSGILNRDPVRTGAAAATANGALDGFVVGAAIEMPRGQRVNVVSPGLLDVSLEQYGAMFPGHEAVSSKRVGLAYAKCVEGALNGEVVTVD